MGSHGISMSIRYLIYCLFVFIFISLQPCLSTSSPTSHSSFPTDHLPKHDNETFFHFWSRNTPLYHSILNNASSFLQDLSAFRNAQLRAMLGTPEDVDESVGFIAEVVAKSLEKYLKISELTRPVDINFVNRFINAEIKRRYSESTTALLWHMLSGTSYALQLSNSVTDLLNYGNFSDTAFALAARSFYHAIDSQQFLRELLLRAKLISDCDDRYLNVNQVLMRYDSVFNTLATAHVVREYDEIQAAFSQLRAVLEQEKQENAALDTDANGNSSNNNGTWLATSFLKTIDTFSENLAILHIFEPLLHPWDYLLLEKSYVLARQYIQEQLEFESLYVEDYGIQLSTLRSNLPQHMAPPTRIGTTIPAICANETMRFERLMGVMYKVFLEEGVIMEGPATHLNREDMYETCVSGVEILFQPFKPEYLDVDCPFDNDMITMTRQRIIPLMKRLYKDQPMPFEHIRFSASAQSSTASYILTSNTARSVFKERVERIMMEKNFVHVRGRPIIPAGLLARNGNSNNGNSEFSWRPKKQLPAQVYLVKERWDAFEQELINMMINSRLDSDVEQLETISQCLMLLTISYPIVELFTPRPYTCTWPMMDMERIASGIPQISEQQHRETFGMDEFLSGNKAEKSEDVSKGNEVLKEKKKKGKKGKKGKSKGKKKPSKPKSRVSRVETVATSEMESETEDVETESEVEESVSFEAVVEEEVKKVDITIPPVTPNQLERQFARIFTKQSSKPLAGPKSKCDTIDQMKASQRMVYSDIALKKDDFAILCSMFDKRAGNVKWNKFVSLMSLLGFKFDGTRGGSRTSFRDIKRTGKAIFTDRPHPGIVMKRGALTGVSIVLEENMAIHPEVFQLFAA